MSEFLVKELFPVSFRPSPFVIGQVTGDFTVGQEVELSKRDGSTYRGVLEALVFHCREGNDFSFVFSTEFSSHIEPGDVVRTVSDLQRAGMNRQLLH